MCLQTACEEALKNTRAVLGSMAAILLFAAVSGVARQPGVARHPGVPSERTPLSTVAACGVTPFSVKQHSSTVALIPPEEVWPPIQAAREALRDKGLYRWPPHINLLYPFVSPDEFGAAIELLSPALATLAPPTITLDSLGCFGGRSRGVLYAYSSSVEETAALRELQAALQAALPTCHEQQRDGVFTPHLTLAHFGCRDDAEAAKERLSPWTSVTFSCEGSVHVMRRDGGGGQFARCCTLEYGLAARTLPTLCEPPERWTSMPSEEPEWVREARKAAFKRGARSGGRRSSRRRPRRSEEERAAIRARTPEEIAEIRAQRAAKRARLELEGRGTGS